MEKKTKRIQIIKNPNLIEDGSDNVKISNWYQQTKEVKKDVHQITSDQQVKKLRYQWVVTMKILVISQNHFTKMDIE